MQRFFHAGTEQRRGKCAVFLVLLALLLLGGCSHERIVHGKGYLVNTQPTQDSHAKDTTKLSTLCS